MIVWTCATVARMDRWVIKSRVTNGVVASVGVTPTKALSNKQHDQLLDVVPEGLLDTGRALVSATAQPLAPSTPKIDEKRECDNSPSVSPPAAAVLPHDSPLRDLKRVSRTSLCDDVEKMISVEDDGHFKVPTETECDCRNVTAPGLVEPNQSASPLTLSIDASPGFPNVVSTVKSLRDYEDELRALVGVLLSVVPADSHHNGDIPPSIALSCLPLIRRLREPIDWEESLNLPYPFDACALSAFPVAPPSLQVGYIPLVLSVVLESTSSVLMVAAAVHQRVRKAALMVGCTREGLDSADFSEEKSADYVNEVRFFVCVCFFLLDLPHSLHKLSLIE